MAFIVALTVMALTGLYPSDLDSYRANPYRGAETPSVVLIEDKLRHVNTVFALAVPLLLRDWVGLKQLSVVTVAGIIATHGPKRLLDQVTVFGTRLGERPHSQDSRHNMPSGHSTLASGVLWFLARRYSWYWLLLTVPVTLATMSARVLLNAHTINSVLVGALVGVLVAALFVTQRARKT